jgi:hypothetical protein
MNVNGRALNRAIGDRVRAARLARGLSPAQYERILEMLVSRAPADEGEEVDTANLAMILWTLRRRR